MDEPVDIAIIGGGFSGALLAILLRDRLAEGRRVVLFEPRRQAGRGPAYEESDDWHVLNAPAVAMSAFAAEPEHFARWLEGQPPEALGPCYREGEPVGRCFAPRRLFGRYMAGLLERAAGPVGDRVEHREVEVTGLAPHAAGGWEVRTAAGVSQGMSQGVSQGAYRARFCVLALGNAPARARDSTCQGLPTLRGLPAAEAVLLVGSGLTMVDHLLALRAQGHRGPVQVVSRHGWLPLSHAAVPAREPWRLSAAPEPGSTLELMRWLRAEARRAVAAGLPWQAVMDAARPRVQALWRGLPEGERRRFLRHGRTPWNLHRHRIAPRIHAIMRAMVESGQVSVAAARLESCTARGDGRTQAVLRHRGSGARETRVVAQVQLCTGPGDGACWAGHPPAAALLSEGLARIDALGLGLDSEAESAAVIGAGGQVVPGLFALGPCAPGALWEVTAVPEIRQQVAALVELLVKLSAQEGGAG